MGEPAEKVAQQTEERLDRVAETVRKKFDAITGSLFGSKPGRAVTRRVAADRASPAPGQASGGTLAADRPASGGNPTADRGSAVGRKRTGDRRS